MSAEQIRAYRGTAMLSFGLAFAASLVVLPAWVGVTELVVQRGARSSSSTPQRSFR